ncbi:LAETG motif-containing sortase-dependent surface protein [Streptomyces echinoruber]|uniref:LAETG motif-containing sortase-dependent surface protein n=1 Tax=Streptomyces echinoruber TaxID=68898 RepID=UPI00167C5ED1|nr:LAETG motif-containing sortase-dependent surface protein [Streptomyces echinoruber]
MKLRRALAAAAMTAAIAPLALSAPAAFAEESPSDSPTASVSESTSESASASSTETTEPTSSESASTTPSASASESASESASPSASTSASTSPSGTPSESAEPTEEPSDCPVDEDGVDPESALSLEVSGLPGKIVAGSGWHNFTLTAANHSDKALGDVQWLAIVDNYSESDNEKDWLSTYAQLEYFNPQTKAWESLADDIGNGVYFGQTELGAKETVDIKLRVNISAKAPAGDGYTIGLGGYLDEEKNCVHSSFAVYEFTVLPAGSSNDNPGEAKPGKGDKPAGGKQPQGGAEEIPATGSLAETGSSSALPMIGLVGGVAVVAGAGAVFVVRRRKAGSEA